VVRPPLPRLLTSACWWLAGLLRPACCACPAVIISAAGALHFLAFAAGAAGAAAAFVMRMLSTPPLPVPGPPPPALPTLPRGTSPRRRWSTTKGYDKQPGRATSVAHQLALELAVRRNCQAARSRTLARKLVRAPLIFRVAANAAGASAAADAAATSLGPAVVAMECVELSCVRHASV
jgi:hypothetical protein